MKSGSVRRKLGGAGAKSKGFALGPVSFGRMMFCCLRIVTIAVAPPATGAIVTVGAGAGYDHTTIQAGVDAAQDGDTVLVARGVYYEYVRLDGKSITLSSEHINSSDDEDIAETVIDGDGSWRGMYVNNVNPETTVRGLTIRNCGDGIYATAKFNLLHCRVTNCTDGIDYEGGGGVCKYNLFANNSDDGIDSDGAVAVVIEHNSIVDNDDDGIEIRLHEYDGPQLVTIVRHNFIVGNGEDGIQLIDYPDVTNRIYYLDNNIIANSVMAGIGCMGDGVSAENYEGADIPERVYVRNNTIVGNDYGVVGGDNMILANNIFAGTKQTAVKSVDGDSQVSHNAFWQNGRDFDGTEPGVGDVHANPLFADTDSHDYHLKSQAGRWDSNSQKWAIDNLTSPCIDAGNIGDPIGNEMFPNGGIVNMGAYGGTAEASKSWFGKAPCKTIIAGDINGDCKVDYTDLAIIAAHWLE